MFFAQDPVGCCRWWAEHVAGSAAVRVEHGGFSWFEHDGVEIAFHPADEDRNPVGASPVVYLATADVEKTRRELIAAGCRPHRGPLALGEGRRICQLVDPFGNVFGLDGP